MHSKYCPHDCLECNESNMLRDGLTREKAIKVFCPMCKIFIYPGNGLYCLSCNKFFQYALKTDLWYITRWRGVECAVKYRGGWWEF